RCIVTTIVRLRAGEVLEGCGKEPSPGETLGSDAENAARFPLSVASGDPRPDTVMLWTRAVQPGASVDLSLRLEVASDSSFTSLLVHTEALPAAPAHDGSLRVKP